MKPVKRSVAVVLRRDDGAFAVVRRPADPADPLAGAWGFPAITLAPGEDERAAVVRLGRAKLGVDLAPGGMLGEAAADRGSHVLRLANYAAAITAGTPSVPQPDASMTQYAELRFTHDPGALAEAAARGSVCARVFLAARADEHETGRADEAGVRVFKCHLQVGDFDPNDPLLDGAWGMLADAGVPEHPVRLLRRPRGPGAGRSRPGLAASRLP